MAGEDRNPFLRPRNQTQLPAWLVQGGRAPVQPQDLRVLVETMFPQATANRRSSVQDSGEAWQQGEIAKSIGASLRSAATVPVGAAVDIFGPPVKGAFDASSGLMEGLFGYERSPKQKPKAAAAPAALGASRGDLTKWATSYQDPVYDSAEARAAQELGLGPEYVDAVKRLRTLGERTNHGQVSSAGARTPYQFIPSTREGMIKKHGVDPWKDPVSGAKAAMLHLADDVKRGATLAQAMVNYHSGWGGAKGPEGRKYAQRVLGMEGAIAEGYGPQWSNPFDAAQPYLNQAMGYLDQANAAAKTPFSMDFQQAPAPAFPELPEMPKRDFSETDQLLETLKPVLIDEKTAKNIRRTNMLQGAAQLLASTPETAHVGKVLANFGAGLAAGRATGDKEIQARIDAYDEKMAAFNLLKFKYAGDKAEALHQDALREVQAVYSHNLAKFNSDMSFWQQNNRTAVQNGYVVTQTMTPDGKGKVIGTPIAPIADMATANAKAEVTLRAATMAQQGASMGASMDNQVIAAGLADQFSRGQDPDGDAAAMATRAYMLAEGVVGGGYAAQAFPTEYADMQEKAKEAALQQGLTPGSKQYDEYVNMRLTEQMMQVLMVSPAARKRLEEYTPIMVGREGARRTRESQTTTRTDSKGRTTVTERY